MRINCAPTARTPPQPRPAPSWVLPDAPTTEEATAFLTQGDELRAAIAATPTRLQARQGERKAMPKKSSAQVAAASERFAQLCPESKHFIDTIIMIAYQAESALAGEARETLTVELHCCGSPL